MFEMTGKQYDTLQKILRCITPLITFLTAIGTIWGLEWMALVTATIAAFNMFLGKVLDVSSKKYKESKEKADTEDVLESEKVDPEVTDAIAAFNMFLGKAFDVSSKKYEESKEKADPEDVLESEEGEEE